MLSGRDGRPGRASPALGSPPLQSTTSACPGDACQGDSRPGGTSPQSPGAAISQGHDQLRPNPVTDDQHSGQRADDCGREHEYVDGGTGCFIDTNPISHGSWDILEHHRYTKHEHIDIDNGNHHGAILAGRGVGLYAHNDSHHLVERDIDSIDAELKLAFDVHNDNPNHHHAVNLDHHVIIERYIGSIDAELAFDVYNDHANYHYTINLDHHVNDVLNDEHFLCHFFHAHNSATRTSDIL